MEKQEEFCGFRPELVHPSAFIAPGAILRGNVHIGPQSSLWYNAVARGDAEVVRVGRRANIQDLSLLHADPGYPCLLGDEVTVGHRAIVHGAVIEDLAMVGMGAIILNGARIGAKSIIAAGSVVTEGQVVPGGVLAVGAPAKVRRELTAEEIERIVRAAAHYVELARRFKVVEEEPLWGTR